MESATDSKKLHVQQPQGDIAIIGMSCIFPGAPDLRTYWQNIVSKVDSVGDPPEKWGAEFFFDADSDANDRIYCKRGGYLKELAEFDPLQYGVMPSSIRGAEPGHFLALRAAYESLADAGYGDKAIEGKGVEVILGKGAQFGPADVNAIQHGVVIDQTLRILRQLHPEHTEEELAAVKRELKAGLAPFNAETVPGLVSNIVTGRINNRLDFMGANYTVDAACASSLVAMERGIQDLRTGRCDMALVGGIEPSMPPLILMIFCQIEALSRKGKIRPFDKEAAGTLLGEGVGVVVIKRREDAVRDGDRIYALIKGVGVSSDGRGAGLLAPRLEGETLALERAYGEAGVSPRTVGLIEAHGTGVALGDVTEIRALAEVFGPREGARPTCAVGSVKSMVSHLVHAAGVAGVIKAALALHHKVLPPTLCDEVNPDLELEKTPFYINTETRPWIHGGDHPRRAGVCSFGFGGINSHAVLEEYVPAGSDSEVDESLSHEWDSEVFILSADSRAELIGECERLRGFISGRGDVALKDLAYTLNCSGRDAASRLAVVAGSAEDLDKKLAVAVKKLNDPRCKSIKDRSGIFFFEQPLGREGTLAFMFPGYGSEYVDMLSDLCMHFPEVRTHFDKLDKVTLRGKREPLPSQVLFPPPLDASRADASREEQIFSETAFVSSAMCTADLALLDLFTRLEIRPDAAVGHSNGEFAALLAGGAVTIRDEEHFMEYALRAQSVYDSFADEIPTAKVLAVGGADPAAVRSLVERSGGALQLTIDNCPHQAVLCGPEEAVSEALNVLQAGGAVCNLMPFDHAVHSPQFQSICDRIAAVHHDLEIAPPKIAVYSCTTARPHTQDVEEIRRLIMNHLARPVRFRETVEAMYEAGVRVFVEVGPKGNLTSFVNDILGDRRYVAVPSNTTNRSGIGQLNFTLGLLAAHHVPMRLDYLYARRSPARVSFDATATQGEKAKSRSIKLALEYPLLKLKGDRRATATAQPARQAEATTTPTPEQLPQPRPAASVLKPSAQAFTTVKPNGNGHDGSGNNGNGHKVNGHNGNGRHGNAHGGNGQGAYALPPALDHVAFEKKSYGGDGRASRSVVMGEYLRTMGRFLDTEQAVVGAFLARRGAKPARVNGFGKIEIPSPQTAQARPQARAARGAFNITVQSIVAGRELAATCYLDLNEHVFLRDHTLGRSPSALDETLTAMPVVPLTISMEIMAQAAALLTPGKRLVGMRNLRSYRWIEVGEGGRVISLTAGVKDAGARREVEVRVSGEAANQRGQSLMAEGVMLFADDYADAPAAGEFECSPERPYHMRPDEYYDLMFHGPCFRSVVSVDAFDRNGMQATLRNPQGARLFRSCESPEFLTDPVLLDGAGQLVGFWTWTLDRFEEGAATFPVGFEALDIYRPFTRGGEAMKCNARISLSADGRTLSDIDIVGRGGELVARLSAWEDMRSLGWAHTFNQFILTPRDVIYSTTWDAPASHFPATSGIQCCSVSDGPGGMWPHVLAWTILNRREREFFSQLRKPERSRREWLLGRLAAKDAARVLIKNRNGLSLCPADIEIVTDEHGQPSLAHDLAERIGCELSISISHSSGRAAAVVGPLGGRRGIGLDIEQQGRAGEALEQVALSPAERGLLSALPAALKDEWLMRVWCAKEAVSKAVGRGMAGSPLNLAAAELRVETGEVILALTGELARQLPEFGDSLLTAHTGREENLIYAVSLV